MVQQRTTIEQFMDILQDNIGVLNMITTAIHPLSKDDKKTIQTGMNELNRFYQNCSNTANFNELSRYIDLQKLQEDWEEMGPILQANAHTMLQEFVEYSNSAKEENCPK